MKNRNITFTTIFLALACFALLPKAHAVVPPPDGGYPNFTTAEGQNALFSLTTGAANTAVGWHSLFSDTGGSFNTATGAGTLLFNTADQNTAFGAAALLFNTTGHSNTAVGTAALLNNNDGFNNTAIGDTALLNNTGGAGNTAVGAAALYSNTGLENTAIGIAAGFGQTTGSRNVYIGAYMGASGESDACYIKSIFGQTSAGGTPVFINSANKLGTSTSSNRFKEQIKPMNEVSEKLFALKPVTFHYKQEIDPVGRLQFGLIAEEVEKVNPDLIVRDQEGKPYSVRYDQVNAMLLNEFLKEHKRVGEQQATIEQLKLNAATQEATISGLNKNVEMLTTQLKEQAAQIQKVSAQMELSNAIGQTALNHP